MKDARYTLGEGEVKGRPIGDEVRKGEEDEAKGKREGLGKLVNSIRQKKKYQFSLIVYFINRD